MTEIPHDAQVEVALTLTARNLAPLREIFSLAVLADAFERYLISVEEEIEKQSAANQKDPQ